MAPNPKTARVVSLEMTWIHFDLELPAGVAVEIPAERLPEVLKLQGVVEAVSPTPAPLTVKE